MSLATRVPLPAPPRAALKLRAVKVVHTVVWAFFASCIVAIPVLAWRGAPANAWRLIAIASIEVVIILVNGWRCPLTNVAARYTSDRRDNFDIYLPAWLARHNKVIFGGVFIVGVIATASRTWMR